MTPPDTLSVHSAEPLLHIRDASVVRGTRALIDHLNLDLMPGQHTAILGPNGSGKSTLVKLITRQLYPLAGGEVRIFGQDRWNVAELRSLMGIVSSAMQLDFDAHPPLEAFDCVVSGFFAARGLWKNHKVTDEMRVRATEALHSAGAAHLTGRDMSSLSTGEARRVLIARALVHRPRALLLDEPCAGLDPAARRSFLESLRGVAATTTLVLVTHHIEEILPEIGHIVMLKDGRVFREGDKADLLTSDALSALFGMPVATRQRGLWYHATVD
ncbi:ATP-binding cassette domain-containing protein [Asticcacaulis sp. EMRT-3]|uniref:ABC transporter ATP-binding protein n=1 Tax=Asticcacaulis sp. EMRT-3 TaxID=3040349 RepID=UPI0024AFF3BE|nr:ATP-binding cassette domain-containing protein [Asticcacaulis sp. EMRT-3]MDI7775299.1 ATP-binding cassette domain-containing protein [Asticcacaulis sp. EMRT-3]